VLCRTVCLKATSHINHYRMTLVSTARNVPIIRSKDEFVFARDETTFASLKQLAADLLA
jgi:hypothetical protein